MMLFKNYKTWYIVTQTVPYHPGVLSGWRQPSVGVGVVTAHFSIVTLHQHGGRPVLLPFLNWKEIWSFHQTIVAFPCLQ